MPIKVSLDVGPSLRSRRFADDVEGAAYFFITETLTNVLKHSKSKSVEIRLGFDGSMLTAQVIDSGVGFDPGAVRGSGLSGLTNRIHALGGEMAVDSHVGAGARLAATLPVSAARVASP